MKKFLITTCAVLMASTALFAQDQTETNRYLAPSHRQHWFVQAEGGFNWWKGEGPMYKYPGLGLSVSLGHWVNHYLGLRLTYDLDQARNNTSTFKYHNLFGNVMISPIDLFRGSFDENRVYSPIFYAGAGIAANTERYSYLLSDSRNHEMSAVVGLIHNIKINKYLDIYMDWEVAMQRWSIDQKKPSKPLVHSDLAASVGLTYHIGGRIYDYPEGCEDAYRTIDSLLDLLKKQDAIIEEEITNAQLQDTPCDTVIKFVQGEDGHCVSAPFSIFFNKGSYQLMSGRDLVNLKEIAKVAKDGNYKIRLRGTCDSATGSVASNQKLAENRCRKIKDEFMKLGIAESSIIVDAVGGVSELVPTEYDRRVFVELMK